MSTIDKVKAYQRFDSRGNPTVKVEVTVNNHTASAMVPSGASTGDHEALELRDHGERFLGLGVEKAIGNVEEIEKILVGHDIFDQVNIDKLMIELDGTENKSRLGANAILAVSMAVVRTAALVSGKEVFHYINSLFGEPKMSLPIPMMNIINGGAHVNWEGSDFQEYMIVPSGADTFSQGLMWGVETYHALKSLLGKKGYSTLVGDEGGFAPNIQSNTKLIDLITDAIVQAGYKPGEEISIALDPAVSEIYDKDNKKYKLHTQNRELTSDEMIIMWEELVNNYPIISLEDALDQDDWEGWTALTQKLGKKVQIVGDDFLVTNTKRIDRAIQEKSANALLVKLNQIGTVTETLNAIAKCKEANWNTIVSHRSGETEDAFISDLCVATASGQIKTGAPARSERVAKYNRLLDIDEIDLVKLSQTVEFTGNTPFTGKQR
ncbi:phosphopyruvate hydratase [Candidatus Woesebacteria bacterium]|nr:MAG: phosphopyruvate hydratase [Candidatus Woesebacteria bacterium]